MTEEQRAAVGSGEPKQVMVTEEDEIKFLASLVTNEAPPNLYFVKEGPRRLCNTINGVFVVEPIPIAGATIKVIKYAPVAEITLTASGEVSRTDVPYVEPPEG